MSCGGDLGAPTKMSKFQITALIFINFPDWSMRKSNVELFDPHALMEESLLAKNNEPVSESDFGFAFNNSNFSDRVLKIEVLPDLPETKSDAEGCTSIANWARNRKRRRQEIRKEAATNVPVHHEEQVLNCNMPDAEEPVSYENHDDIPVAMIEESPSGTFPPTIFKAPFQLSCRGLVIWIHCTVFAYGNTNSGKTYTMQGSQTEPGVIPLAVHDLFQTIQKEKRRDTWCPGNLLRENPREEMCAKIEEIDKEEQQVLPKEDNGKVADE